VGTWRAGGFKIVQYQNDHPPLHVHVLRDDELVAKYDLERGRFMFLREGFRGRVLRALELVGFIREETK